MTSTADDLLGRDSFPPGISRLRRNEANEKTLVLLMESTGPLPGLTDLVTRPAWQAQAACRGRGTTEFFPIGGGDSLSARLVCRSCPVAKECLEYALERPGLKGIWGGTSERHRDRMRALQRTENGGQRTRVRSETARSTRVRRRPSGQSPSRSAPGRTTPRAPGSKLTPK
jgi:WhiB family redox-sensing transcriptional regulator